MRFDLHKDIGGARLRKVVDALLAHKDDFVRVTGREPKQITVYSDDLAEIQRSAWLGMPAHKRPNSHFQLNMYANGILLVTNTAISR